jgi:hypothetical protein
MTKLFQVETPTFVAGFCVDAKNVIWRTAPILKWMEDKPLYVAESYCRKRGWKLKEVNAEKTERDTKGEAKADPGVEQAVDPTET